MSIINSNVCSSIVQKKRYFICNDTWYLVLLYCDLKMLATIGNTCKSLRKMLSEKLSHKKWEYEELKSLVKMKTQFLPHLIIQEKWIYPIFNVQCFFRFVCYHLDSPLVLQSLLNVYPQLKPCTNKNYAIRRSCSNGHIEITRFFLNHPLVNPADNKNEAIINASYHGHYDIVKLLLHDSRVNPSDQNNQAIIDACQCGHTKIVFLLLQDSRVDPSAQNNLAIIYACQHGHFEITELLLKNGKVNPSAQNNKALQWTIYGKYENIKNLLLLDPRVRKILDHVQ